MAKQKPEEQTEKKRCAVTRKQFAEKAPATIVIKVNDVPVVAARREFEGGSFGYFANEKVPMEVDGVPVRFQCNLCITAVNSKNEPK